jgi:hypothetical protein
MSKKHFDENSGKEYTLTLFLSFAAVFVFALLFMLWHGLYKPGQESLVRVYDGPSAGKPIQVVKEPSSSDSIHYAR